jgi:hypothetical protein
VDDLAAAQVAEAAVLGAHTACLAELNRVEAEMRRIRLAKIHETALELSREAARLAAASGEPLMSLRGLKEAILQQADAAGHRHDERAQQDYLAEFAALNALAAPIVNADLETVAKRAREWTGALT